MAAWVSTCLGVIIVYYLVCGGGCPEQEAVRELAAVEGRGARARARQELVSEQEQEPHHLGRHRRSRSRCYCSVLLSEALPVSLKLEPELSFVGAHLPILWAVAVVVRHGR